MKYLIFSILLLVTAVCKAQEYRPLKFRTINGTVTDKNGVAIANCSVSFAGISMGGTTDSKGNFKLHFPDEPIMITVYNRADNHKYYIKVNPDQQVLNITLDKTTADISDKNLEDWHKNETIYANRISQAIQSEEFYEYVHNGQHRGAFAGDPEVSIDVSPKQPTDTNMVYVSVEKAPRFGDNPSDWTSYLKANLHYPDKARQDNLKGRVYVSFIVEKDGSLTDIKVERSLSPECDLEAVRLVKASPKWTAARRSDKNVRCRYTCPILFSI